MRDHVRMDTSEKIRFAMVAQRLTGADLARRLLVSPSTVTRWRTGATRPRGLHLVALAKLLGCSPQWLISDNHDGGEP